MITTGAEWGLLPGVPGAAGGEYWARQSWTRGGRPIPSEALACVGAGWWGWGAGGLEVLQQRLQLPQAGVHVLLQPLLHGALGEDAVQGGCQLLREGAPPAQETETRQV